MEPEIRLKIEETVIEILSSANLEEVTEFKVRVAAADRLGIDLSSPERKRLVRDAIESFLVPPSESEKKPQQPESRNVDKEVNDFGGRVICKLSDKRNVVVHDIRDSTLVSIREFYRKDGKQIPSAKGISLSVEQWSSFKQNVPDIEEAIRKMESKLRTEVDAKQKTENVPNLVTDIPHEHRIKVDRFDGKNYKCWEQQMQLLLKQLKIEYVLYEPCPSVTLGPEASLREINQAKATEQKWKNDDHICFRDILSSLSDHLFHLYYKKTMTAKELWDELKLVHLCEEYRPKRSQVKKYIEYQMVEERSIVDQVREINNIADSIVGAGMVLEEQFHVNVIISKLPPSWKDVSIKLMCEDYLPFWMLMNRLGVEEETRNRGKEKVPPANDALRTGHPKPHLMHPEKRVFPIKSKVVCRACGKKGHIALHCRSNTWRRDKDFAEKRNWDNRSSPPPTETSTVDGVANGLSPSSASNNNAKRRRNYGSFD